MTALEPFFLRLYSFYNSWFLKKKIKRIPKIQSQNMLVFLGGVPLISGIVQCIFYDLSCLSAHSDNNKEIFIHNTFHITEKMPPIYITKISKSVCMYVCMYVCMSGYAFRHALRYRAESWHGGRGRAHEVCGHIFEATWPGVKGHPRVNLP